MALGFGGGVAGIGGMAWWRFVGEIGLSRRRREGATGNR